MNWENLTEEQVRQWAIDHRTRYRRGLLSPEVVAACESIPNWSWDYINRTFRPFEEARTFVRSLELKNVDDWKTYCRKPTQKPLDIPSNPNHIYKNAGWIGYGDWLGTNRRRKDFLPFSEARAFVQKLGLKNGTEWRAYRKSGKKPFNIPPNPEDIYKVEWAGMGDWLGTGNTHGGEWPRRQKEMLPFDEARTFARSMGLKSKTDWNGFSKTLPANIPVDPSQVYKDKGWISWGDWLGTGNIRGYNKMGRDLHAEQLKMEQPDEYGQVEKREPLSKKDETRIIHEGPKRREPAPADPPSVTIVPIVEPFDPQRMKKRPK
jgi:hypothetical protein